MRDGRFVVDCALRRTADGAASLVIEKCTGGGLAVFLRRVEECVRRFDGQVGIRRAFSAAARAFAAVIDVPHEGFADGA